MSEWLWVVGSTTAILVTIQILSAQFNSIQFNSYPLAWASLYLDADISLSFKRHDGQQPPSPVMIPHKDDYEEIFNCTGT